MQNKKDLEDSLKIKITIKGNNVEVDAKDELEEYFATRVIEALDYKFLIEDALFLKREDYDLKIVNIKDHTTRHDMDVIKGRIIGTKGKTLDTLRDLTGCDFSVKDNEVAIMGHVENIHKAEEAIISLIKGSKQGNVYAHLEGLNREKKKWKRD